MWKTATTCVVLALSTLAFLGLAPTPVEAQGGIMQRLNGRLRADGRPVDWLVEIRLERVSGGIAGTAYTLSGDEFEFRNIPVNTSEIYLLIVEEPDFEVYREEVRLGRDAFGRVFAYNGMFIIDLRRRPPEEQRDGETGALAVDVRQLLAEIPDEARDAYGEAIGFLENGNRAEGIALLERALVLAPDYYEALNRLGVEYFAERRYRDAEAVLERAVDLNRNDPIPLMNLGVLHFQEGRELEDRESEGTRTGADGDSSTSFQRAVEAFEATLRLDPTSATAAYYLGVSLHETGNPERAEALLLEALGRDPNLSDARLTLINIYVEQDRTQAAIVQIEAYLDENPEAANRESLDDLRDRLEAEP